MDKERKPINWFIISGFIMTLIAVVTMTVDHVGVLLQVNVGMNYTPAVLMRYIGRLALPLFCFKVAEGVLHSKSPSKYLLRLGIMGTIISAAMIIVEYAPFFDSYSLRGFGNIYVDLFLGALSIFLLTRNKWYLKALVILPIALAITSFFVSCLENTETIIIHWYPFFLKSQFGIYSVGMIVGFYLVRYLRDFFLQSYSDKSGIPVDSLKGTAIDRFALNVFSFGVVVIFTIALFIVSFFIPQEWIFWLRGIQNAAIISGAFLLLYNGNRGYNAKWFQYSVYLYYPLHLLVIFGLILFL